MKAQSYWSWKAAIEKSGNDQEKRSVIALVALPAPFEQWRPAETLMIENLGSVVYQV
jgi:hypothetical protein